MRHSVQKSKLSLTWSKRKALMNALARAMIINGRIQTTRQRAKNARPLVEHLISLAKEGTLSARRRAFRVLQDHLLVRRLFNEIAPKFKGRFGGYSRVILLNRRRGDGTEMALFELTEIVKEKKTKSEKKEKLKARPAEEKSHAETPHKKQEEKREKIAPIQEMARVAGEKEEKPQVEKPKSAPPEERKHKKADITDKTKKHEKFLGGLRNLFKKKSDSL